MRANYKAGNYGYGTAKQAFYELLVIKYAVERERYNYYMNNLKEIDEALAIGAVKARKVAFEVLKRVRAKLGY
jgi:tryptophanyl-tRNA synthetase